MTLKEFAKLVGMSQTTVSRALNGHPEVNEKTRARLIEAARHHGYAANDHARFLATGHASIIGCVIPVTGRSEIVNPIYADFLAGAGEECSARRFDINLSMVADDEQAQAYRRLKSKGLIGGVIVQFPRHDDSRPALLDSIGLPYVVHGRVTGHDAPYSWVDVNNQRAFERATGFLLQLGHRRIAFLNGIEDFDFAYRRRQGYLAALRDAGLSADPAMMASCEMTAAYGYGQTKRLLAMPDPPTAILCSATTIATGIRQAAEERDLTLGVDLSVVTFDDDLSYYANRDTVPFFTAMRSGVRMAGRLCAQRLIERMGTRNTPATTQDLLEAELVVGRSTAPPR